MDLAPRLPLRRRFLSAAVALVACAAAVTAVTAAASPLPPDSTGYLAGTVNDIFSAPLPGVTVEILHTSIPNALTDTTGAYTITGIPAGPAYDAIYGLLPGYGAAWQRFAIVAGQGTLQDAVLPSAETFEEGSGPYQGVAPWQWGVPSNPNGPHGAFSGTHCWATGLAANYPNNATGSLTSPTLDPTTFPTLFLSFTHWYDMQAGFDGGNIQVSMNNQGWITAQPIGGYPAASVVGLGGDPGWTGVSGGWQPVVVDLTPYRLSHLRVRFHFGSDAAINGPGWFVDDVSIYLGYTTAGAGGDAPAQAAIRLSPARPNPFRDESVIGFRLGAGAVAARLLVLDATGRLIRDLYAGPAGTGERAVVWDGRDGGGRSVPAGVYYYSLEADGRNAASRAIVRVR